LYKLQLKTLCILRREQERARQGTKGLLPIDRSPEEKKLIQGTFEQTAKVVSDIIRRLSGDSCRLNPFLP
jgi:hypothetical protein